MAAPKIITYAPNIHKGGGIILLKSLIEAWPINIKFKGFLDSRAEELLELPKNSEVIWVKNTFLSRLKSDFILARQSNQEDIVVTYHGIPPIFRLKSKLVSFLQNRALIDNIKLLDYSKKTRFRLILERFLFKILYTRVDEFIVQSDTFKSQLTCWFKNRNFFKNQSPVVTILPFTKPIQSEDIDFKSTNQWDFIYVADGLPHKNHKKLLDSWLDLADQKLFPSLALTLSPDETELLRIVDELKRRGLKIFNIGEQSHEQILQYYLKSDALIYPSTLESFGLPLIEAQSLNLPILASELDYVYEVCSPVYTFDPNSSKSITRAVMKFLKVDHIPQKIKTPSEFLSYIIER